MGAPAELARALALRFAGAGADIGLTTATGDAAEAFELRRASRAVTESGRQCLVESVDMSIGTGVQVTVRQVAKALGRIDVLIIAPDFQLVRPAERLSDAEWSKVLNLNLSAVFYACRAGAREMFRLEPSPDRGTRGRIVVVTRLPRAEDGVAYRSAKAGVTGLAEALQDEWVVRGVGVQMVVMGETEDLESVAGRVFDVVESTADGKRISR